MIIMMFVFITSFIVTSNSYQCISLDVLDNHLFFYHNNCNDTLLVLGTRSKIILIFFFEKIDLKS